MVGIFAMSVGDEVIESLLKVCKKRRWIGLVGLTLERAGGDKRKCRPFSGSLHFLHKVML